MTERRDAVVVGGGLAGLAAATFLAQAGRRTLLLERAAHPGGRARTQVEGGYHLNLGPHALYVDGPAEQVLTELRVLAPGGVPPPSGLAVREGRLFALPAGPLSLLTTGLLSWSDKLEAACVLARLPRLDPGPLDGLSVDAWLERTLTRGAVRDLLLALVRVATYVDDPARLSAGLAVRQLRAVLERGVRYVDGGWQTLVDGLLRAAGAAGVEVRSPAAARSLVHGEDEVVVGLDRGAQVTAGVVVLALAPDDVRALLPGSADAARWAEGAAPVRVACLDLGLSRLPEPGRRFALGIDASLYFSVHSGTARLSPEGGAVVHAAKYLGPHPSDAGRDLQQVEGLLDLVQPGWRDVVVARRWLPRMTACAAAPLAALGGPAGRPGPEVPGHPRVLVAGDWVGPAGHLADAALASARAAARAALALPTPARA